MFSADCWLKGRKVCSQEHGPVCKYAITDMYIGSSTITWCNSIRYLGVNIESGSCFKVDTDIVWRKFFASCLMSFWVPVIVYTKLSCYV